MSIGLRFWPCSGLQVLIGALSCSLVACAAAPRGAVVTDRGHASRASPSNGCDVARDRAAIRAMAGEFRVSFAFDEVQALADKYALKGPYRAGATEVVELLEETERTLVLQHVLVLTAADGTASPMKHWRQDWTFEDADLVEFRGKRTFEHRALSPEQARCTWSQAVFEVDDGPRYESYGRWSHDGETSAWTSEETWRPLPRREYTKRSDYDVLVAVNRHIVSTGGWSHEQDNVKLALDGRRQLVRERGLNRYERATLPDAAAARAYLRETEPFWSVVRREWQSVLSQSPRFTLLAEIDGNPRYESLFDLAQASGEPLEPRLARARALIGRLIQQRESRAVQMGAHGSGAPPAMNKKGLAKK